MTIEIDHEFPVEADEQEIELEDSRDDLPVFIHSELDDFGLTSKGFRVYAHLVRRCGSKNKAWPSYRSIGETCFRADMKTAKPETLRRLAMAAVAELKEKNLIAVQSRKRADGNNMSNVFRLTARKEWKK